MEALLEVARCPRTGQRLQAEGTRLVTQDGSLSYRVEDGIPVLLPEEAREERR